MSNVLKMLSRGGAAAAETDPNFNQTVLLLHGDGTNGAQNNTFLDSSTNNFTITRNGNTTQGTFSPFSVGAGEWSNYFDGSGDNLSTSATLGSGDFTLEFWFYPLSVASGLQLTGSYSSLSTGHWIMFGAAGNKITLYNGPALEMTLNINAWNHICWVRSSGTSTWYHNGVSVSSAADTTNWTGTGTLYIGGGGTANNTNGYISNYRLVKGVAIIPPSGGPTSPLTAVSGTDYLTCQSNRFVDNSSSPKTITRNGDVRVTPFSPFAPTAAYSAGTNGGSGYFDGTGDSISAPTNAAFNMGSGDCTFEAWVYLDNLSGSRTILSCLNSGATNGYSFFIKSSGFLSFECGVGGYQQITATNNALKPREWNFVAFTRTSGTNRFFVNGVSATFSGSMTNNLDTGGSIMRVGTSGFSGGSSFFVGNIGDVRILKGTGGTTSTVPTAPLTAIANTELLLNFTNAGIIDNTGKNNLETVADAQIDTTVKKFGTGSLEFDGTGDWLKTSSPDNYNFLHGKTSAYTIEAWIYPESLSGRRTILLTGAASASSGVLFETDGTALDFTIYRSVSGSFTLATGGTLTVNTWHHVAVSVTTTEIKLFLDGVLLDTETWSLAGSTANAQTNLTIGGDPLASAAGDFDGFIDDLRITKGVARYTANFTPPTKEFPDL